MDSDEEAWGQLVSVTDVDSSAIPLVAEKIRIGRAKECDISLAENKLVSGRHCYLQRDDDGTVYLHDTSKNGTLLNLTTKVSNGNKKELHHGDEFYIVYKKNEDAINVGYMYQNMEELRKEMDATQDYSPDLGMDATLVDDEVNMVDDEEDDNTPTSSAKRSLDESTDEPEKKRIKHSSSSESPQKEKSDDVKNSSGETTVAAKIEASDNKPSTTASPAACSDTDEIEEALICTICQELLHDCISLQPCMHSFCAGCYSDWMERSNECPTCRMKVERINKNHIVNNLIDAYLKEHPGKKRPEEDIKELDAKNKISRDMLYPKQKNRDVNWDSSSDSSSDSSDNNEGSSYTPVSSFLPAPAPLFGFGTPVFGAVRPLKTVCRQCPEYVVQNTTVVTTQTNTGNTGIMAGIRNVVTNLIGGNGNQGNQNNTAGPNTTGNNESATSGDDSQATLPQDGADSAEAGPSNADKAAEEDQKTMPVTPEFRCIPQQTHVLCQCCLQPMPDRRTEYFRDPTSVPAQQCTVCYRSFCHAYWGCRKADCNGCIEKFKDLNFGKKCLGNLILDNPHESEILKNYLEKNNISVKAVLKKCIEKLEIGEFTCVDYARHNLSGNTPLCYPCGLRNFKELAYLYRYQIPKEDLPADVTARSDCYWGKNCRTQRNKPLHARRFNHICNQTRTT